MTAVFGEKPFIRYTEKCKDGTIFAFLRTSTAASKPPTRHHATDKSPGNETATKSVDKRDRWRGKAPVVRTRRGGKAQGPQPKSSR
jgi:hypothetical protein